MTPPIRMVSVPVADLEEVRDLLMERRHGSPARSPAHNARLCVEAMLTAAPVREEGGVEDGGRLFAEVPLGVAALYRDLENGIRPILATREEAPAEAGEPSLVDWFSQFIERHQEGCGSDTDALIACLDRVRDSYRAQPPAREDDWTPFELKPNDIANIIDRHADCGDDGLHNASQLAELIYQAGKKYDTHPAPAALRVAVEALERIAHGGTYFAAGAMRDVAAEAFAALQAEQKGGA